MGDVFLEQIVKKQSTVKEKIGKALILFGCVFLSLAIFFVSFATGALGNDYFGTLLFLLVVAPLFLAWYIITGLNLEFEYIYTNGEIDFDKISAKRKRKRITTIRISSFEVFELYDHEKYKNEKFDKVIHASACYQYDDTYCVTFRGKDGQHILMTFSPNEKLLATINAQYKKRRNTSI